MRVIRYHPRALTGDGGITNAVQQWSRAAATHGAECLVLCDGASRGIPPGSDVEYRSVPHHGIGSVRVPIGLEQHLRGGDVLVLHSGWTIHNAVAAAAARRARVPYVLEPRGAYDPHIVRRRGRTKATFWRVTERHVVQGARAIHVFFEEEASHLGRIGYAGPVIVSPNGVTADTQARWTGGGNRCILWLGRFDPEHKGLDILLRAVACLSAADRPRLMLRGPDWRGRKAIVEQMIDSLRIGAWVQVGPPLYGEAKWQLVANCGAFVYPSRWEAFGNSLAEAALLGVPVVATRYPLANYLADRSAALVTEPREADLAEAIHCALQEPGRLMGPRGQSVVRNELSWTTVSNAWLTQAQALL
jgi:glycosyltransferase involved in cell wall biosynthesis